MMSRVMRTRWEDLVMVNYEVDRGWVEQFVPEGCELELFGGRAMVSVVAFRFSKTKLLGISMPIYREFGEVNLRIYVRRKGAVGGALEGNRQRGVVFIKEIIAHRLPAWVANTVFRENFVVMPVAYAAGDEGVSYSWGDGGRNYVRGDFDGELEEWEKGSVEEFIGDNYWAYKDLGKGKTVVFEVSHRPWLMRKLKKVEMEIDIASLYGEVWAKHMKAMPRSVFYVAGSEVEVTLPVRLEGGGFDI